jgi:hypothetical protein
VSLSQRASIKTPLFCEFNISEDIGVAVPRPFKAHPSHPVGGRRVMQVAASLGTGARRRPACSGLPAAFVQNRIAHGVVVDRSRLSANAKMPIER